MRAFAWLGGGGLVLVIAAVGLRTWSPRAEAALPRRFCDAIVSGDPGRVLALMDESLVEQVDPPLLRLWMRHVTERLGPFRGLDAADFATTRQYGATGWVTESTGDATFENGIMHVRLTSRDDKLVGYEVSGDGLDEHWLTTSPADELYRTRAREFIEHLVAREADAAIAMTHDSLRARLTKDQLVEGMTRLVAECGELEGIEIIDEEFVAAPFDKSLTVRMLCRFGRQALEADVQFEFDATRGQIVGFHIPAD